MKRFTLFLTLLILSSATLAQNGKGNHDPSKVRFFTADIERFWHAYDLAAKETTRDRKAEIFNKEYLYKASDGLEDFARMRIRRAEWLVDAIARRPKFYASIRESTERVSTMDTAIREIFGKFVDIYPEAVVPDVYFVVGTAGTGGTIGRSGLLVGAEMYGRNDNMPNEELSEWQRSVIAPIEDVTAIVAHEACHYNQDLAEPKTLLGKAIQEGSCDFIGEMISGRNINARLSEYGHTNDAELWREFQEEMDKQDLSKWLYNGYSIKYRPADLGYYVGYRIAASYYSQADDKTQALRDILHIKDFRKFLKASRYNASEQELRSQTASP